MGTKKRKTITRKYVRRVDQKADDEQLRRALLQALKAGVTEEQTHVHMLAELVTIRELMQKQDKIFEGIARTAKRTVKARRRARSIK